LEQSVGLPKNPSWVQVIFWAIAGLMATHIARITGKQHPSSFFIGTFSFGDENVFYLFEKGFILVIKMQGQIGHLITIRHLLEKT
jgi:hypothetical protein